MNPAPDAVGAAPSGRAARSGRARGPTPTLGTLAAALLLLGAPEAARSGELLAAEYGLRAAFIFQFTRFVDWPPEAFAGPSEPYVVALVGAAEPFGPLLEETLGRRSSRGRGFTFRRWLHGGAVERCHVLYVTATGEREVLDFLAAVRGRPVLTVGEGPDFTRLGGMVRLFAEGDRLRMEINPTAAAAAGLELSSDLLKLASITSPAGGTR